MTSPNDVSIWGTLQAALGYVHHAVFEIQRDDSEAALIWLDDVRRALGEVALAMSERDSGARIGYSKLAEHILTPPSDSARSGIHRTGEPC